MKFTHLCEVRLPTYRRPELLSRALRSLQMQTHENWRCIVFDDSPDGDALSVVKSINDHRVNYFKNPVRMGAEGNIDQCFRKESYLNGKYFCVLEDDNYLLPKFLEDNIRACVDNGVQLLLRNQLVENEDMMPVSLMTRCTLDNCYTEGTYEPEFAWAESIYGLGVSNGALFWSSLAKSNFEVATSKTSAVLQENIRAISVFDRFLVLLSPLAVFRGIESQSMRAPLFSGKKHWMVDFREIQYVRQVAFEMIQKKCNASSILLSDRLCKPFSVREEAIARIGKSLIDLKNHISWKRDLEIRAKAFAIEKLINIAPELREKCDALRFRTFHEK